MLYHKARQFCLSICLFHSSSASKWLDDHMPVSYKFCISKFTLKYCCQCNQLRTEFCDKWVHFTAIIWNVTPRPTSVSSCRITKLLTGMKMLDYRVKLQQRSTVHRWGRLVSSPRCLYTATCVHQRPDAAAAAACHLSLLYADVFHRHSLHAAEIYSLAVKYKRNSQLLSVWTFPRTFPGHIPPGSPPGQFPSPTRLLTYYVKFECWCKDMIFVYTHYTMANPNPNSNPNPNHNYNYGGNVLHHVTRT